MEWLFFPSFDVRLIATASTPTDSVFEVQFRGHGGFNIVTLYVATGSTVDEGATVGFMFGVGEMLIPNYSYRVTVEKIA